MIDSFLYSQLPRTKAIEAGYFDAPKRPAILPQVRLGLIPVSPSAKPNPHLNVIAYYPGAFGEFHKGHVNVVWRAWKDIKRTPDSAIVIAPAHSSYAVAKYGNTLQATNGYRARNILAAFKDAPFPVYLAVDQLLNATEDYNVTDQIEHFALSGTVVRIVTGKDRNWKGLNGLHPCVAVEYYDDETGASTSQMALTPLRRKTCLVRTPSPEKFSLFKRTFQHHYSSVQHVDTREERKWAKSFVGEASTICKEYADILPYYKVSRKFAHPWDLNPTIECNANLSGLWVDSDTYSGATKCFIESCGGTLHTYLDVSDYTETFEIVDISDFEAGTYVYPFVDVAERCSMMPWGVEDYANMATFLSQLKDM